MHAQSNQLESSEWRQYWDSKETNPNGFTIYKRGESLSINTSPTKSKTYVFLLHGAGYSSLTWSLFVSQFEHVHFVAYDLRGHGSTTAPASDLSSETLSNDTLHIIESTIHVDMAKEKEATWTPNVVIIGHSAGGAIAIRTASKLNSTWLHGLVVIDIVEETAIRVIPYMKRAIASRPSAFSSTQEAIKWALNSNTLKNQESAQISIPSQLFYHQKTNTYRWIVNLQDTEPYWKDWYKDLSNSFLAVPCAKVLILSGTDCLDDKLLVGQMQGKFQLSVLPKSGHAIQEDCPLETASIVFKFLKRQKLVGQNITIPSLESDSRLQCIGAETQM